MKASMVGSKSRFPPCSPTNHHQTEIKTFEFLFRKKIYALKIAAPEFPECKKK